MSKKLIFIQLNEINFDLVEKYIVGSGKDKFPNLSYIKNFYNNFTTFSENEYKNLEPWIQWASVHLGKEYNSHQIFRLGDIINHPKQEQIFEKIEAKGFKVGAISPMNAANKLKNPTYFIPDPWTNTKPDNSGFSKRISLMLKQSVNENASKKLSINSIITIFEIIFRTFNYRKTLFLIRLVFSLINKPWKKSLVLDYLIHNLHLYFLKKKIVNFSSIFLNAGAHIQHHYLYNTKHIENLPKNPNWYIKSSSDPIEDMLFIYDKIIGDYIKLSKNSTQLVIATGLSQVPYHETKFYWRLKNHEGFLKKIGCPFSRVIPRMSRDFLIEFSNIEAAKNCQRLLESYKMRSDDEIIFKVDNNGDSLFVELIYSNPIKQNDMIYSQIDQNREVNNFKSYLAFVAIKNGEHNGIGYVTSNFNLNLGKKIHLKEVCLIV